jgi:Arc/MetJ family transcription regulator
MRTTVTIDDELWQDAKEYSGISENSDLIRKALRDLVAREAGRRLAALGGTMPDLVVPGRARRPEDWSAFE